MSEATLSRVRAAIVAVAPLLLLIGFIYLPYVNDWTDQAKVAEAVTDDATRWAWAGIILAVGLGFMLAACVAIRMHLAAEGEQRWSALAVLLLVVGGPLFLESHAHLGYTYAEGAGANIETMFSSAGDWSALLIIATAIFGLGWLSLAMAIYRSRVLSRELTWASVLGLVVLTVMLFIPMGWATYAAGVAAIVGLWPIAYHMWAPAAQTMMMGRGAGAAPA